MASLVVLKLHLWMNLTEMKDANKIPFLDSPVSLNGLFGPAVEGFAERFTAAQKEMRHFLPKHSSSAAASSSTPQKASILGADGRMFVENTAVNLSNSAHTTNCYLKREHFSSSPYDEPQVPARPIQDCPF